MWAEYKRICEAKSVGVRVGAVIGTGFFPVLGSVLGGAVGSCQFPVRQENILVMAISVGRVPRFRAYLLYLSLYLYLFL